MSDKPKNPEYWNNSSEMLKQNDVLLTLNLNKVDDLLWINSFESLSDYLWLEETPEMIELKKQAIENMKSKWLWGDAYKKYNVLCNTLIIELTWKENPDYHLILKIALWLRQALMYYKAWLKDYFEEDIEELLLFENRLIQDDEQLKRFFNGLSLQIRAIKDKM